MGEKGRWESLPLGWRIALATGVPFGFAMMCLSFPTGPFAPLIGLMAGVFFGAGMAVVLGLLQASSTSGAGQAVDVSVNASTTVFLDLPVDEALALGERVLVEKSLEVERKSGPEGGEREARTGATWKSWGEILTISATRVSDQTALRIASRPVLATTVIDYGRNAANVSELSARVRELAGLGPETPQADAALDEELARKRAALRDGVASKS